MTQNSEKVMVVEPVQVWKKVRGPKKVLEPGKRQEKVPGTLLSSPKEVTVSRGRDAPSVSADSPMVPCTSWPKARSLRPRCSVPSVGLPLAGITAT